MENLFRTLQWLDLQFSHPRDALARHRERPPARAFRDFREDHLPFLLAYPLVLLLSPWTWIHYFLGGGIPSLRALALPVFIVLAVLLLAVFFDKIREYRTAPGLRKEQPAERNIALFFSLPVSASLIFFLVHPAAGFLALLASLAYSFLQFARYEASARNSPLRNVVAEMIVAAGFLLIPVAGLLLLYNLALTSRILVDLF